MVLIKASSFDHFHSVTTKVYLLRRQLLRKQGLEAVYLQTASAYKHIHRNFASKIRPVGCLVFSLSFLIP